MGLRRSAGRWRRRCGRGEGRTPGIAGTMARQCPAWCVVGVVCSVSAHLPAPEGDVCLAEGAADIAHVERWQVDEGAEETRGCRDGGAIEVLEECQVHVHVHLAHGRCWIASAHLLSTLVVCLVGRLAMCLGRFCMLALHWWTVHALMLDACVPQCDRGAPLLKRGRKDNTRMVMINQSINASMH